MSDNLRIPLAEAIGTAVLVIAGPGTAIFATGGFNPDLNVTIMGVALAFGLSLLTMAYLIGRISGCHINPAVTIGMLVTKKLDAAKAAPYFIGQFVGGIAGAGILALILSGTDGYLSKAQDAGFASNGFGDHSPSGFGLLSVAIIEIVVTAIFVLIVLGTTDENGVPKGFGPIAAGFGLTLVHLISIPVSNTSVNPARSLATAIFQGDWALGQVWPSSSSRQSVPHSPEPCGGSSGPPRSKPPAPPPEPGRCEFGVTRAVGWVFPAPDSFSLRCRSSCAII